MRRRGKEDGRGERIRTSGLYVPNVALYQAKLHPDLLTPRHQTTKGTLPCPFCLLCRGDFQWSRVTAKAANCSKQSRCLEFGSISSAVRAMPASASAWRRV